MHRLLTVLLSFLQCFHCVVVVMAVVIVLVVVLLVVTSAIVINLQTKLQVMSDFL